MSIKRIGVLTGGGDAPGPDAMGGEDTLGWE